MNTEELMAKAADHIVTVLDGWTGEKWEGDSPKYEGVCGWCGVMAPLNRPAFVAIDTAHAMWVEEMMKGK